MPALATFRRSLTPLLVGAAAALAGSACDETVRPRDAGAAAPVRSAEVAVRLDVPSGGAPSLSVLAFRATAGNVDTGTLLSAVDPLMTRAPRQGRCELRQVDDAARALRGQRGYADLEELEGVAVELGTGDAAPVEPVRPVPRLFPGLASVSGVLAEAGPKDLGDLPATLVLRAGGIEGGGAELAVPAAGRLLGPDGQPFTGGKLALRDTSFSVSPAPSAPSFLELRPYGATISAACPLGESGSVIVGRDTLEALARAGGPVPVSADIVTRSESLVTSAAGPTRVTVEVRTSVLVELQP